MTFSKDPSVVRARRRKTDASIPPVAPRTAISRVIAHMEQRYDSDIKHKTLASIAGMTTSHFSFAFRKQTGKRPTDYLSDIRIRKSKRLLTDRGLSVKEAAAKVGFEDEYYFSRRFKQRIGVAPTVYVQVQKSEMNIVSLTYTGQLLALGIKPAGAPRQHLANQAFDPMKCGIADVGDFFQIDLNAVAGLSPDLIVVSAEMPDLGDFNSQLRQIAPTATISYDNGNVFQHLQQIAMLLDKEKEAEEWICRHQQQVKLARKAVMSRISKDETVSMLRLFPGYISLWSGKEFGHVLYQSLGLQPPNQVAGLMDDHKFFSPLNLNLEELAPFAGDSLFISLADHPDSHAYFRQVSQHPAWQQLPAVRNGRIYVVPDTKWKFYEPRAISSQLQEAVHLLSHR